MSFSSMMPATQRCSISVEVRLVQLNKLEDGFVGTPFFIKDKIIIRGSQTVYCIGEKH